MITKILVRIHTENSSKDYVFEHNDINLPSPNQKKLRTFIKFVENLKVNFPKKKKETIQYKAF